MAIREAIRNPICSDCGGPAIIGEISLEEQQLRIENARLKEELERVCGVAGKLLARPSSWPAAEYGDRSVYLEVAVAAMEELVKKAKAEEPLWVGERMNEEEYERMFSGIGGRINGNGFVCEGSRETAIVLLNSSALVHTLMDAVSSLSLSLSLVTL